jgi:hypothetical protein
MMTPKTKTTPAKDKGTPKKKDLARENIINSLIDKRRSMLSKQNCDSCGERCAD